MGQFRVEFKQCWPWNVGKEVQEIGDWLRLKCIEMLPTIISKLIEDSGFVGFGDARAEARHAKFKGTTKAKYWLVTFSTRVKGTVRVAHVAVWVDRATSPDTLFVMWAKPDASVVSLEIVDSQVGNRIQFDP